jgi:hypothetical protein
MNEGPQKKLAADGHEYHLSATANATVAPTNQHTLDNATKASGLTEDQQEVLTAFDYEWHITGGNPDPPTIRKDYGIPVDTYNAYLALPAFQSAMKIRGLPLPAFKDSSSDSEPVGNSPVGIKAKLTPIQLVVANSIMDMEDTRSTKKKLQDVGCTTTQLNAWYKDKEFTSYLQQRAEQLIGTDLKHEALLALADRVRSGDMKAIEYYHEFSGQFVRQSANSSSGANLDVQSIITRIIEIVVDEVEDSETAIRIANRLKGLVLGNQVANSLMNPSEIEKPQVAKPRELTPEVEQLMARGVGYDS